MQTQQPFAMETSVPLDCTIVWTGTRVGIFITALFLPDIYFIKNLRKNDCLLKHIKVQRVYKYLEACTNLLIYQRQSGRRFYPLMHRWRVRITFWSHCHTGVPCKNKSYKSPKHIKMEGLETFLPVCLYGPSPNKSLTTARALSERASTSFNSSWSENTCRRKPTPSSLKMKSL